MTQIIKVKAGSEPESVESVPWVHPYNSSMPFESLLRRKPPTSSDTNSNGVKGPFDFYGGPTHDPVFLFAYNTSVQKNQICSGALCLGIFFLDMFLPP